MKDPRWSVLESALLEYLRKNFLDITAKRDTEFNTIWELAFSEGGKYHLQKFFKEIEEESMRDGIRIL